MSEPIVAKYGAVPNKSPAGGWLPMVWYSGRARGHEYWPTGYDQDQALAMAKFEAEDLLERNHVDRIEEANSSGIPNSSKP